MLSGISDLVDGALQMGFHRESQGANYMYFPVISVINEHLYKTSQCVKYKSYTERCEKWNGI